MKNIGMSIFAMMVLVSCGKKVEEKTTEVNNTATETKTVVVDTVHAEQPKDDGTSVKVNSDGVDVKSKDVDVEIKK